MSGARRSLLDLWRERGQGWSPLFAEPMLALALPHLEPGLDAGGTVLDLGAGQGHVAASFRDRGATAVALDVDPATLAGGRAQDPGPLHVAGDQARLPFPSASLDAIFSFSSLQYSDRDQVLTECRRVLRPGGRIAVVENLAGNPVAWMGRRLRRLARTPYPPHLTPRGHLRWEERTIYERFFRDVRFDVFHLLTPVLMASNAVASAPVERANATLAGALYRILDRCDRLLLPRMPAAAWSVVIRATR